ncbi:hypothetical protein FOMPIDRAFT_1056832, partial [Fomitopsis schrenkii]
GKGKRAAPAKVRTPPSSIDEVESEDEDPGEATSTRKGKRKSVAPVAAHAPPAKKARATPAKKTQPAASAKKTVPAGPAKTTRAAAAATTRKMLEVAAKPARRKSQSNTAQSASKEAEPEARALLVQFKGKYRCRGCSRKDGSTDEVPLCQVYGKSSRCKQCNAGHRDCEISEIIYVKVFVIVNQKTRDGVYELYDGSGAFYDALQAAGLTGLKVHVTQAQAIERLTKEVDSLKKSLKAVLSTTKGSEAESAVEDEEEDDVNEEEDEANADAEGELDEEEA